MSYPIWHFHEGTEERVEVLFLDDDRPEERRWIIQCGECGTNFTLRPDHGVTVGADGALSAEHSFNCPKCKQWHRHIRGGVIQP